MPVGEGRRHAASARLFPVIACILVCFLVFLGGLGYLLAPRGVKSRALQRRYASWEDYYREAPSAYEELERPAAPVVLGRDGGVETLPLFLIIGAQKSGTTSTRLHLMKDRSSTAALGGSVTEVHFLDDCNVSCDHPESVLGSDTERRESILARMARDYSAALTAAQPLRSRRAVLNGGFLADGTPLYSYLPMAVEWGTNILPHVQLVMIVRNPVERYFSALRMEMCRGGQIERAFHFPGHMEDFIGNTMKHYLELSSAAFPGEPECSDFYSSVDGKLLCERPMLKMGDALLRGLYADQLDRWIGDGAFHPSRLLLLSSDELFGNFSGSMSRIEDHVGIISPWSVRFDEELRRPELGTGGCEYVLRTSYLKFISESWSQGDVHRLVEFFKPHNERLYEYAGRDYGWNDIPMEVLKEKLKESIYHPGE